MSDDEDVFFKCTNCGREVREGQTYWSVNLHKETIDEGCVTVHQADMIAGYCSKECLLASGYDIPEWMRN